MVVKKNSLKEAPYDSLGSLLHWADRRHDPGAWAAAAEWRPNEPMELCLTIDHTVSGRSAKYVIWKGRDGTTYPMFVADLIEMLRECTIASGIIWGMFRVRKRGQNFGLTYVGKVN